MDWFFDGVGTLLLGLVLGGGAGGVAGYRIAFSRHKQSQRAGHNASQTQAGRDINR